MNLNSFSGERSSMEGQNNLFEVPYHQNNESSRDLTIQNNSSQIRPFGANDKLEEHKNNRLSGINDGSDEFGNNLLMDQNGRILNDVSDDSLRHRSIRSNLRGQEISSRSGYDQADIESEEEKQQNQILNNTQNSSGNGNLQNLSISSAQNRAIELFCNRLEETISFNRNQQSRISVIALFRAKFKKFFIQSYNEYIRQSLNQEGYFKDIYSLSDPETGYKITLRMQREFQPRTENSGDNQGPLGNLLEALDLNDLLEELDFSEEQGQIRFSFDQSREDSQEIDYGINLESGEVVRRLLPEAAELSKERRKSVFFSWKSLHKILQIGFPWMNKLTEVHSQPLIINVTYEKIGDQGTGEENAGEMISVNVPEIKYKVAWALLGTAFRFLCLFIILYIICSTYFWLIEVQTPKIRDLPMTEGERECAALIVIAVFGILFLNLIISIILSTFTERKFDKVIAILIWSPIVIILVFLIIPESLLGITKLFV